MRLYVVVALLVVFGVVGDIAAGGIFPIILVPVAVIVLVAGLAYRGMGHAAGDGSGQTAAEPPRPTGLQQ
jgi:hypothetical protein